MEQINNPGFLTGEEAQNKFKEASAGSEQTFESKIITFSEAGAEIAHSVDPGSSGAEDQVTEGNDELR